MNKYPKILSLSMMAQMDLKPKGTFYVQEKIDGSQFRFGIDSKGNRFFGTKSIDYNDERPPDKMFVKAVQNANEALDRLVDWYGEDAFDTWFFAEYLQSPKHDTLTYARVPAGNLMVFDMMFEGKWLTNWQSVNVVLDHIGLEKIPTYAAIKSFPNIDGIKNILDTKTPVLGGSIIEGVVIKNYDMMIDVHGQVRPLFYKYVRDGFKELNAKEWSTHPGKRPITDEIAGIFNKEAIFQKAVQHLQENGDYTGELRDIAKLIPLVYQDLYEEYRPQINEMLWKHYQKDIEKTLIRGLPEFYKQYLYKQVQDILTDKNE